MPLSSSEGPSSGELASLGVYLAAAVLLPLLGGIALDGAFKSAPVFLFVGLGVGIVAAVAGFYVRLKRYL
jgi:F0F1-type ATP synthase assembly protein I